MVRLFLNALQCGHTHILYPVCVMHLFPCTVPEKNVFIQQLLVFCALNSMCLKYPDFLQFYCLNSAVSILQANIFWYQYKYL